MRGGTEITMADDTITDPPVAGDPNADPISSGSPPKPAPIYTKEELTRITSREVGKVAADRDALAAKLAEYEKREAAEAEAKLSKEQRATLERKREIEAYEAKVNALTQQAATERTKRHEVLRAGKAASLASTLAAQVANPGLLPHVERSTAERRVAAVGEDGAERVVIQRGAPGDGEPLEVARRSRTSPRPTR